MCGRSLARSTANVAVANGKHAMTTAPCAELSSTSAIDDSNGNPIPTPAATTTNRGTSRQPGHGVRVTTK